MFLNKVILITGASSGVGRELAIQLAQKGAQLMLTARRRDQLEETASLCAQFGSKPLICSGDITKFEDCQRIIAYTMSQYTQLDHLVLNAGISMLAAFDTLPNLDIIHDTMETNYFGPIYCVHAALPHLKNSRGLITVISSVQAKIGVPLHSGYAASKHALNGFFDSLRIELNRQVDILIVCPSWIAQTALKSKAYQVNTLQPTAPSSIAKTEKMSIDLAICVKKIVQAMRNRPREISIPKHYAWVSVIKFLMPSGLDRLIQKKVGKRISRSNTNIDVSM